MTLIMVTHDTSMKFFSHRVIHMIDGKIHRIETIEPHVRAAAHRTLAQKVEEVGFFCLF